MKTPGTYYWEGLPEDAKEAALSAPAGAEKFAHAVRMSVIRTLISYETHILNDTATWSDWPPTAEEYDAVHAKLVELRQYVQANFLTEADPTSI